jgi:hypothetical protein
LSVSLCVFAPLHAGQGRDQAADAEFGKMHQTATLKYSQTTMPTTTSSTASRKRQDRKMVQYERAACHRADN